MQYVLLLVLYYIPFGCMHYTCRCLHYHLAGLRFIRQTRLCCHTLVLRITTSVSCSTCPNPSYAWHASSSSYLRHYIIFQSHIIPKVYCSSLFYDSCDIFLSIISEYGFNINYWKCVSTMRGCSVSSALLRS